jgi:hypothetical protein
MFPAKQECAKTTDYAGAPEVPPSAGEIEGSHNLEQARATLAENEKWLTRNADKILPASEYDVAATWEDDHAKRAILVKDDDRVLRCLGAAVMMRWSTLPAKLQRELFDHASSLVDFDQDGSIDPAEQATRLKELIARFLHDHGGVDRADPLALKQHAGHGRETTSNGLDQ